MYKYRYLYNYLKSCLEFYLLLFCNNNYDFVHLDADMAKKGVDCVKIIQSFYDMMKV